MLFYEETLLEVWASALWEVMKKTLGTNLFLSNPLLKERQHTMMEELGNDKNYLIISYIQIVCFLCAKACPHLK